MKSHQLQPPENGPKNGPKRRPIKVRKASFRSIVTNGQRIQPGVDGRSALARRYADICAAVIADHGGIDLLAEVRLQLIRRFSAACVLAEQQEARMANGETIDVQQHALLTSSLVRVAQRIGINRRAREIVPTLASYLENTSAEDAA
jgi:hypothetical protein